MCLCVFAFMWARVCGCARRDQRLMAGVFLKCRPLYLLEQAWRAANSASPVGQLSQGITHFCHCHPDMTEYRFPWASVSWVGEALGITVFWESGCVSLNAASLIHLVSLPFLLVSFRGHSWRISYSSSLFLTVPSLDDHTLQPVTSTSELSSLVSGMALFFWPSLRSWSSWVRRLWLFHPCLFPPH